MTERTGYYRTTETQAEEEEEHGGAGYHDPGYVGEGPEGRMLGRGVEVLRTSAAGTPIEGVGPHRGRGPRGYRRSPQRIFEDVCDRLTESQWVDAHDIEIRVEDDQVILEGFVHDTRERALASEVVSQVSGVSRVVNHLEVHREPGQGRLR